MRRAAELAPGESTVVLHLASALAEAGQDAESEILMGRYRQMRPPQAPRDLMRYLSLTPEQQRADYRARVEKAVQEHPEDAIAQLHYLKLSLEEGQVDQAVAAAGAIAKLKTSAAVMADAGRALLEARQYAPAREVLEKAAAADPSAGLELDIAIAVFQTSGAADGLRQLERVPASRRGAGISSRARADAGRCGQSRRCHRGDESRDRGFAERSGLVLAGFRSAYPAMSADASAHQTALQGRASHAAGAADSR